MWRRQWENGGCRPAPWAPRPVGGTSVHSGAWPSLHASLCFCEFLTPFQTSHFSEHFLPPLMSSILPSIIYSGVTFSCFPMKIPSFLGSLSPSRIQYLALIYPAFLFLRTTPFTLSSRPALAVDSVSRDISSRGNTVLWVHKSSCIFTWVWPSQLSGPQVLRELLGLLTDGGSSLLPNFQSAV